MRRFKAAFTALTALSTGIRRAGISRYLGRGVVRARALRRLLFREDHNSRCLMTCRFGRRRPQSGALFIATVSHHAGMGVACRVIVTVGMVVVCVVAHVHMGGPVPMPRMPVASYPMKAVPVAWDPDMSVSDR